MTFYLLDAQYDGSLNCVFLIFYDTKTQKLTKLRDNTNFKPYCITDLKKDTTNFTNFYAYCLQQMIDKKSIKIGGVARLLPIIPEEKFNPLTNQTESYNRVIGRTPLDIANVRGFSKGGIAISKYLQHDEVFAEEDDDLVDEDEETNETLDAFLPKEDKQNEQIKTIYHAWENGIKFHYSFIFDNKLRFGMPYRLERRDVMVYEPNRCKCNKRDSNVGRYEYWISDDNNEILLKRIVCKGCGRTLFYDEDITEEEYSIYGIVEREFDYIKIKRNVIVPVEEDVTIDPKIIDTIKESLKNENQAEIDLIPEMLPLFFAPVPEINRQSMDIEVWADDRYTFPSPEKAEYPVTCVCFKTYDGKRYAYAKEVWKKIGKFGDKIPKDTEINVYENSDEGEKNLIQDVFEQFTHNPILLTYNGDSFDLLYLLNRGLRLGIEQKKIPLKKVVRMGENKKPLTYMFIKDVIHLDLIHFFRNKSLKAYAFKSAYLQNNLDSVAEALLKKQKTSHEILNEQGKEKSIIEYDKTELIYYCLADTEITLELTTFKKNLVMSLTFMLMRLCKTAIVDIFHHQLSFWVKNMIYFHLRSHNCLINNKKEIEEICTANTIAVIDSKKFQGAIVIDPIKGIHFAVSVYDFASLYPSAIKTRNLSYETVDNCSHPDCMENIIPETKHWVCKRRVGILALLVGFIRDIRVNYFKNWAEIYEKDHNELADIFKVIEQVLKVFINGSYGVFGSISFPFFQIGVAEGTTAIGRYCTKDLMKHVLDKGFIIVGGDTDSIFIKKPTKELMDFLITYSKDVLHIETALDKEYRFLAMSDRKKNYIGFYKQKEGLKNWDDKKGDDKWKQPEMKGVSGKKSNIPKFIKKKFKEIIRFVDENVNNEKDLDNALNGMSKMIRDFIVDIKNHKYSIEDLAFVSKLTQDPIKGYKKTSPQHVQVARKVLRNKTMFDDMFNINVKHKKIEEGDYIAYIKTRGKDSCKSVDDVKDWSKVNINKYIDQIGTVFAQFLDCFNLNFEEIINPHKKLDGFIVKKEVKKNGKM